MRTKKRGAPGRPKSAEVRKAFQVMLLEAEKAKLREAMEREGRLRSLSHWVADTALQRARRLTR